MTKPCVIALLLVLLLAAPSLAAPQIIILGIDAQEGGGIRVTAVFWFPVPVGEELPNAGAGSSFVGATTAQLDEIRAGRVREEVKSYAFPSSLTLAQVQSFLQAAWTDRQAYLAGKPASGKFYGFSWDGTAWSDLTP